MTTDVATIAVDEKLYNEVRTQSRRVDDARSEYNSAAEEAKECKKALEGAQKTLESLIRRLTAPESDLPLFANQTDAIAAAQADPVVTTLVERLLARGHDVNALIVFGYTEDERAQVAKYLDILEANDAEAARMADGAEDASLTAVEVPAFLIAQPLSPIEISDLLVRLAETGHTFDAETIMSWGQSMVADCRAWLTAVETVKTDKGENVVFDDLPTAPAWLFEQPVASADPSDGEPVQAVEELAEDVDDADGNQATADV